MKLGLLICSVIGLLGFCGTGCTNDAGTLGATTYPEGDDVRVMRDTLNVEVTSCAVEKVFSKLPYGALGVVTDALWGTTSVDFMAQFYYPEGFSFPSTIVKNDGNKDYNGINSVGLRLYYSTISGTASKSMTIKVYECDKKSLDASERYTNVNPDDYSSRNTLLGSGSFTATSPLQSTQYIEVSMNRNLAKRIVDASLPTNKRVPEIYVTTEGTEGLIFNITNTDLVFYYRYKDKNNNEVDGNSMVSVTKEVVQMNHVINGWNTGTVLKNNDTAAFIHAPAMIFAQVAFPNSFVKKLPSIQGLNTVNLNLPCIGPNAKRFSDPMPNYVLVMKKSEVPDFFKNHRAHDDKTSFLAKLDSTRNSTTGVYEYTYNAHNIANYFVSYRNSDPQNTTAWDTLGIVPVMVTKNSSGDIQRVDSYVYPASIQFIKGLERGRVLVVYSTF